MKEPSPHFHDAIERFDAANAQDPNVVRVDGAPVGKELLYARRMTRRLERLEPGASEALRLAVRSQHLCRWRIPRSDYPKTRSGYLQWRTALGRFHAETAGRILREAGYDEPIIARVQALLRKEGLKRDPETQTLEDVACLVFLEHYFPEFSEQHEEEKIVSILRKTWRKMSPRAREEALKLELPPQKRRLIEKALADPPADAPAGPRSSEPT